jgi:hypothetical protein
MSRRGLFSIVNTALLGAAVVVMFLFPQYAGYALYAIIGWIAAGLTLTWSGWANGPPPNPAASLASGTPLASGGAAPTIDFCVFCGRRFAAGERVCVDCRHPLPRADVPNA